MRGKSVFNKKTIILQEKNKPNVTSFTVYRWVRELTFLPEGGGGSTTDLRKRRTRVVGRGKRASPTSLFAVIMWLGRASSVFRWSFFPLTYLYTSFQLSITRLCLHDANDGLDSCPIIISIHDSPAEQEDEDTPTTTATLTALISWGLFHTLQKGRCEVRQKEDYLGLD